ncbi:MAG: 50S ribosomal protein L28 [Alphaproteobacteria bacterium]|nr:50S ribosomal protein L28 [Alphaproteobacteria bacterium]
MSRTCQVTGKKRQIGHKVSHANNKTKRTFNTNLRSARLFSESLKRYVSMKVTANGLRTIEHNGGIDGWLLSQTPSKLSTTLRKVREQVAEATKAAK